MATRYVDPSTSNSAGGNGTTTALSGVNRAYFSLSEWEAARQADLTATETEECICLTAEGTADTTAASVDGWTTDATHYIDIKTDPAYRHAGVWNTAKYRLEVSGAMVFQTMESYTRVTGLQSLCLTNDKASFYDGGTNSLFDACIAKGQFSGGTNYTGGFDLEGTNGTCRNCIAYDFVDAGTTAWGFIMYMTGTVTLDNCTAHNCQYGYRFDAGTAVNATNCGAVACITSGFHGTNITRVTCSPQTGTGSATPTFVNEAGDNFHLASSDTTWINQGTDLSGTFTTDIDGNYRRYTWDIGAHEYGATSTAIQTRYVDPNSTAGGDGTSSALSGAYRAFVSLSAWETARQRDITVAGRAVVEEVICSTNGGAADTADCFIDGWTTDATHYIDIKTAAAYRHAGIYDTTKYRMEVDGGLAIGEYDVRVTGLQVYCVNTSSAVREAIACGSGSGQVAQYYIVSNIVRFDSSGANTRLGVHLTSSGNAGSTLIVVNNLIYGAGTGSTNMRGINHVTDADFTVYAYNNTIVDMYYGIIVTQPCVAKNNIVQGATDGYNGTFTTSDYNISNVASDAPSASYRSNLATTVTFVGGTDYHLSASDTMAINVGTDLSADSVYPFTTDIDGETRSGTWDIGADEFVPLPPRMGYLKPVLIRPYRFSPGNAR